ICDFLARLLKETTGVTLLITAPAGIGLPGEHVLALAGLPTPVGDDPAAIADSPSVRLFVERADRAAGGFQPAAQDWPAIAAICRLLEGNPLGIELAAAWVEHWRPADILGALRNTCNERSVPTAAYDAPPAVEAAFDGRFDLLAPAERDALAQLTVFRGDFSEQAAEAIAGASRETLTALSERLLLQAPAPGRYAMHRLIRRFMLARGALPLDAFAPRGPQLQDRHSTYYLRLLAQREAGLEKRDMTKTLAELQAEWRHIQQAWEWAAVRGDAERLQQSANALSRYLALRGLYSTAERLFHRAAAALEGQPPATGPMAEATQLTTTLTRGQLLLFQARFLNLQRNHERLFAVAEAARILFQQALDRAQAENIRELAIACRSNLGNIAVLQNDFNAARDHLEAALQLYQPGDEPQVEANLFSGLGVVMMLYGDYAAARRYLERALQACRRVGNRMGEVLASFNLGRVADAVGLYEEAQHSFAHALQLARNLGDERLEGQVLTGLALLHCHTKDYNSAWEMSHDALRLAEAIGNRPAVAEALIVSGDALLGLGMAAEA
ncbi:MAG: ATP-binding protein, partial [Anaerolineae bacterium]